MSQEELIQKIVEQALEQSSGLRVGDTITPALQGGLLLGLEIARRAIKEIRDELVVIRTALTALKESQAEGTQSVVPLLEEIIRQGRHQRRFNGWTTNTLKMIFSKLPGTGNVLVDPVPGDDDGH